MFEALRVENNFEFDTDGISYLADLNHDKLHKVQEFLKKEQSDFEVNMRKVTEIGDEEKKILIRRYARGGR